MLKRYVVRKEFFGGIIYDKTTFDYYYINNFGYNILHNLFTLGISKSYELYSAEKDNIKIFEYLNNLKDIGLYNDSICCFELINNPIIGDFLSAPLKVFLTVTEYCNLSCKHCFGDFGIGKHMNLDNIIKILDELKSIGVLEISITGGEPLTHPQIDDIISEIITRGFNVQICTNGISIKNSTLDLLKQYNSNFFRFSISLDGVKDIHDEIRGTGTYDKVISTMKRLNEHKIHFAVNSVLMSNNINLLESFVDQLADLEITSCSFNPIRKLGRAQENEYLSLKQESYSNDMKKTIDTLLRYSIEKDMSFYFYRGHIISNGTISSQSDKIALLDLLKLKTCGAGNIILTIKSNGTLSPCVYLEDVFKNKKIESESLFNKSLLEIWNNNNQFEYIRNSNKNKTCKHCNLNNINCSGSCPADPIFSKINDCDLKKFKELFIKNNLSKEVVNYE